MADPAHAYATLPCPHCGAALAPGSLVCASCTGLVHAAALKRLAAEAQQATATGDRTTALTRWREAVGLLPAGSRQHAVIQQTIVTLSRELDGAAPASPGTSNAQGSMPKWLARLGPVGLLIWKAKFAVLFLLGKGKLLLLGLTKLSTFLSMAVTFGLYWELWGWRWALGIVLMIYVHEMGHVAALRRYGLPATPPMFIPGFGALVRLKQYPATPVEDATTGLAGPIWGGAAAFVCWLAFLATGWSSLGAIARTAAWINLFNLIPVWQLDGSRGFAALSRIDRAIAGGVTLVTGLLLGDGMALLVGGVGLVRAMGKGAPARGHRVTLLKYLALVIGLGLLAGMGPVPSRTSPL